MNRNASLCIRNAIAGLGFLAGACYAAEDFTSVERASLAELEALNLDASHVDVEISEGDSESLTATLKQTLYSGDPQNCLLALRVAEKGEVLNIRTEAPKVAWGAMCKVDRKLLIALDQKSLRRVQWQVTHGDLLAHRLGVPEQVVEVGHGAITIDVLEGDRASLKVSHGHLKAGEVTVSQLKLKGAHSDMTFNTLNSAQITGGFSHGNVRMASVQAEDIKFKQAHGALEIAQHSSGRVSITNSHGPIKLRGGEAKTVSLENSHGGIYYEGVSAALRAKNSHGGVELIQQNASFQKIEGDAKHGSLRVKVPEQSVCNFSAPNIKQLKSTVMKSGEDCKVADSGGELTLSGSHSHVTVTAL